MNDEPNNAGMPPVADRATFQAELDALRVREKAHTREGDAIAAARRRLPMVEMDPTTSLTGLDGPVTLLEAFEGRRQLIAYYFMWHPGRPAAEQCEVEEMDYSYALMDLTMYGRQELWEDSPPGWPQQWHVDGSNTRTNGRPVAQWSRLEAGRSEDLGTDDLGTGGR
jgi:predicted dithiol-disulfide oxidoreductase (DUF899 family)